MTRSPCLIFFLAASLAVGLGFAGCASTQSRFGEITPNMTEDQVRQTMKDGPTRFEKIAESPYSSWYWGNQYCVLFQNGRVVAKDSATGGNEVKIGPGSYQETTNAQCLAPGQVATGVRERTINIPGAGTIHLPLTNNDIVSGGGDSSS